MLNYLFFIVLDILDVKYYKISYNHITYLINFTVR